MHNRFVIGVIVERWLLSGCTFNFPLFPGPGPLQETQVGRDRQSQNTVDQISGVIVRKIKRDSARLPA